MALLFAGVVGLVLAAALSASAQDFPKEGRDPFRGVTMKPASGEYLVLKDVNVRAKPDTKSARVGSLSKGNRVEAVGMAKGAWLAVKQHGLDLGFVYAPVLVPLIDGALEGDLEGKVTVVGGVFCRYAIHFEGKTTVEDGPFEISDYIVTFRCDDKGKTLEFPGYMFMTEAPYQLSQDQAYQISLDIRDVGESFEDTFSTTLIYRPKKQKVVFDGTTLKEFQGKPKSKEGAAKTVPEALQMAVEIALGAWNSKVWVALAGERG